MREALRTGCKALESARCLESEREANLLLASTILSQGGAPQVDVTDMPGGVQDAWMVLSEASTAPVSASEGATTTGEISTGGIKAHQIPDSTKEEITVTMGQGQLGKSVQMVALSESLKKVADLKVSIEERKHVEGVTLKKALRSCKSVVPPTQNGGAAVWLQMFDERLREIKTYHARHEEPIASNKRPRLGNPSADGYDLASQVVESVRPLTDGTMYQVEEVMGKYLNLQPLYEESVVPIKNVFVPGDSSDGKGFGFADFLTILSKGLAHLPEAKKLSERKKYVRFLMALESYLEGFLERTQPLLNRNDVTQDAIATFEKDWRKSGGCEGWEAKEAEGSMVQYPSDNSGSLSRLDLTPFKTAEELEKSIDGDVLKVELSRLGMKCGGRPLDRAKRLFMTKDTPLDQLPKKLFVNKAPAGNKITATTAKNEQRVDIARREVVVTALLNQLKPTVEATSKRTERRETQTVREREKETDEDLHGSTVEGPKVKNDDDEDADSDDEDAPIYNPKGVPLGWDGKPIPYWLFKLHGLNHFYPCEICGNESYRGRRNFETHFAEAKHAFGMKSLGIPNTQHFHGVTNIEDAQELWEKLKGRLQEEQFDGTKDEEYEDSHGNVLSRATYEDLARQGLL